MEGPPGAQSGIHIVQSPLVPFVRHDAMSDLMAYGALNAALGRGFRVPEDISIHGFDGLEHSAFTRPALSTVSLPLLEMGTKSAETLSRIMNHEHPETHSVLLPCSHMARSTVAWNRG